MPPDARNGRDEPGKTAPYRISKALAPYGFSLGGCVMSADTILTGSLQTILPSLIGGVVTAAVSVRLALKRFRSERWWERKAQAYSDLLLSLFHIQIHAKRSLEEVVDGVTLDESYMATLSKRAADGFAEIRKAAALGRFLFSTEVSERLLRLEQALDSPGHNLAPHEEIEDLYGVVTSALTDLRPMALRDLEL
jgi:hypothetical protein